ncbi:hypothetical protein EJ110_NYTH22499 [Nymphaea thermarum]|nr:hypothetical protein EJ110_NYTH22499 [Nymphaea thermarum]
MEKGLKPDFPVLVKLVKDLHRSGRGNVAEDLTYVGNKVARSSENGCIRLVFILWCHCHFSILNNPRWDEAASIVSLIQSIRAIKLLRYERVATTSFVVNVARSIGETSDFPHAGGSEATWVKVERSVLLLPFLFARGSSSSQRRWRLRKASLKHQVLGDCLPHDGALKTRAEDVVRLRASNGQHWKTQRQITRAKKRFLPPVLFLSDWWCLKNRWKLHRRANRERKSGPSLVPSSVGER